MVELDSNLNVLAADHAMQIPDRGDFDYGSSPTVFQGAGCPVQFSVLNKIGDLFLYDRDAIAAGAAAGPAHRRPGRPGPGAERDERLVAGASSSWSARSRSRTPRPGQKAGLIAHKLGADCRLTQVWNTQLSAAGVYFSPPMLANGVAYLGTGRERDRGGGGRQDRRQAVGVAQGQQADVRPADRRQRDAVRRLAGTRTCTPTASAAAAAPRRRPRPPAPRPGGGNLVQNGSFEADTSGWVSWQGVLSRVLTGVNGQDGQYGALVSFGGCPGCTDFTIDDSAPTVANPQVGTTYAATAYVKSEDVAGRKVDAGAARERRAAAVQATRLGAGHGQQPVVQAHREPHHHRQRPHGAGGVPRAVRGAGRATTSSWTRSRS